ncbi:MAG: terpene cyclase/mutase family protein [Pirellulaceae bacterium]|nr:terpene cyclase/mutase family protein [Pirellulaceae bacterium]
MIDQKTETAIRDALAWLASRQHEDGSFGSGDMRGNTAVTALCGMAFLAGGSTPNRGPHGEQVDLAVEYLLARTEQSGLIIDRRAASQGPMYGHGFATMFLAECYGMSRRPELREKLVRAVKLIVDSQNSEGGWRYWPDSTDADISVTICQIMALRAARNAGIHVPKPTVDRCVEYVKKCQNPDGGFTYMLGDRRESLFPRSAAGVVVLYSAGIYEGTEIAGGLDYLMRFLPDGKPGRESPHYYYGQYYGVQAMWHAGGERWKKWYPAARDDLLARRAANAPYWTSPHTADYATAMACIVLQVPYDYLPIFQR